MNKRLIIGLFAILLLSLTAHATTVGPNAPVALFNDTGTGTQWINPGNAASTNGSFATYTTTTVGSMNSALASNQYGFSIPGTSTVNGLSFAVLWKESVSGMYKDTGPSFCGNVSTICTTRGNASTSTITTTLATTTYGGSSDNWGGITAADINDSQSTLYLFADKVTTTSAVLSVDSITETVFYTVPSTSLQGYMMMGVGSFNTPAVTPQGINCTYSDLCLLSPLLMDPV